LRPVTVLLLLLPVLCARVTAQSATQLKTEKSVSENVPDSAERERTPEEWQRMIDDIIAIADEEIERTSQEAVKAALVEVGGELAAEQKKCERYESTAHELETENGILQKENVQLRRQLAFWKPCGIVCGAAALGTGCGMLVLRFGGK
jgi:hypothetical protein